MDVAVREQRTGGQGRGGRVAVLLKGYPRLSETFIAQELLGLERAGMELLLVSLRHPTDGAVHPVHREIAAPVRYLPEYLHDEPLRVLKGWWRARRLPGYRAAVRKVLADLRGDFTRHRWRRFGQALVAAAELPADVTRLHAHFIHTPASVAQYASLLTGLPWTCSAHAKDIWTAGEAELREKLASARWVVTCTRAGYERLRELAPDPARVHLSYHGLDLDRFGHWPAVRPAPDGSGQAVELLSVCRAVEKKGLDTLLKALAALPADLLWRWSHIGSGELIPALRAQAESLGIADRLRWLGALPQNEVLEAYRASDLFVLPCRIAADGDRDGLPNVLVEAQSQGLCCLSTDVSGVPELIVDGETGILVPPDDPGSLAAALQRAIRDPLLRDRLGRNGERRVRSAFDHRESIGYLLRLFAAEPAARSAS